MLIARPATECAAAVLGPQMIGRGLRLHEASLKKDAVIIELMDEKILSSVATHGARKTDLGSLLATGYG